MILTPCLPWKSCVICESRLYPKAATPEKRAAKLAHQAGDYGRRAFMFIRMGATGDAYETARKAFGFAALALAQHEQTARRVA